MKSSVHVKSIPGSATKGMMKYHVRWFLEDNSPDTAIFHFGTNNLRNNKRAEDIATDIMNLAISVKNGKKIVVASGITVGNDKINDKGKNVSGWGDRGWVLSHSFFYLCFCLLVSHVLSLF